MASLKLMNFGFLSCEQWIPAFGGMTTRRVLGCFLLLFVFLSPLQAYARSMSQAERAHIEEARFYMEAGQWEYAGYEWRAALAANPRSVRAHVGLADMLMQSGQNEEALNYLRGVRKNLQRLPVELAYGKALEKTGRYSIAAAVYRRNLRLSPGNPESFQRLVAVQPRLPRPVERRKVGQYLAQISTDAARRGQQGIRERQYEAAARQLALRALYRPSPGDINNYGTVLLLLGRYRDARKQFKRLDFMNARQPGANADRWKIQANDAFVALGEERAVAAVDKMQRAISLCDDPVQRALLYNDLGFMHESRSRWTKARSAYERAVQLDPHLIKAKNNLAYAMMKERDYNAAIRVYRAMSRDNPDDAKLLNRLGFAYELAHKNWRARKTYRRAIRRAPNDQAAYDNLVALYRKSGEQRKADRIHRQAMAMQYDALEADARLNAGRGKTKMLSAAVTLSVPPPETSDKTLLDFADVFFIGES